MAVSDMTMQVKESYKIKAPFFAYATINEWKPIALPDSIFNLGPIGNYLNLISKKSKPILIEIGRAD